MARNEEEVLKNLKVEFESANAATSASLGLTPMQTEEETALEHADRSSSGDDDHTLTRHSLQ